MSEEWQRLSRDNKWQWILQDLDAKKQLEPVYPFNSPGDSIVLYDGLVGGIAANERPCKIELVFGDKTWVRWSVEQDPSDLPMSSRTVDLRLQRGGQDWTVTAHGNISDGGWLNHAEFVTPGAQVQRVVAHWINLPEILGNTSIANESADGSGNCWVGRWQTEVDGWRIAIDRRHDYRSTKAETEVDSVFVLTHVMEVRRVDGGSFDVESAELVLECLRVCLSFAFGRWVAPALPVGYDSTDQVVWEEWSAPICHPAQEIGSAWLYRLRRDDLTELVEHALRAFLDPTRKGTTRFQMVSAVAAVETGFVDQRIHSTFPALENLAWVILVLGGSITLRNDRYPPGSSAKKRLQELLKRAHIPTDIDDVALPALAAFATAENLSDGPAAVTEVRNRMVHPRSPDDEIYHLGGLLHDAWLLSRHYLNLLILHSIGYQGSYVTLLPPYGRAGNAKPVPWAATTQ